jgi:hypothetical protein
MEATRRCTLVAMVAVGLFAACACGTSSAPGKPRVARITPHTMGGEAGTIAAAGDSDAAGGRVSVGDGAVQRARRPAGAGSDDESSAAPMRDPCTLVHRSEVRGAARANVVGATIAPLGPTCIYQLAGLPSEITLAVEPGRLSVVARPLRRSRRVTVAGHHAYCGTLGGQRLLVSVSAGTILDVTAPCRVAVPLALKALTRMGSRA